MRPDRAGRTLPPLAGTALLGAGIATWYAFRRPMCNQAVDGRCSPNIVYLGAALLCVLAALSLIAARRYSTH